MMRSIMLLPAPLTSFVQTQNTWGQILPIHVLSRKFRGKYMAELKRLWQDGRLVFGGTSEKYRNHYTFHELMDACYKKEWIPHCKETFNGAQSVIAYLGKYTHRIAVSNHRILCMDEKTVTFSVKDYKNGGGWKTLTVFGVEFVRRFLMHVPPKRFVRIRHYGILASRNKKKLITLCQNLLGCRAYLSQLKDKTGPEIIKQLWGVDICKCRRCGGRIVSHHKVIPLRN